MTRHWRALVGAFTFLTRLPVSGLAAHDPGDLPLSVVYFPLVGLVIALAGGVAFGIALTMWTSAIAVLLSIAATVFATGAFHEDALADAFDGFGGGWMRDQVLSIMKDSRVGSYALVGVTLTLGVKALALVTVADSAPMDTPIARTITLARALVAGHVLGRWSSVPLIWRLPYVRPTVEGERASAGKPFVDGVTLSRVAAASALSGLIVVLALGRRAVAPIVVAVVVTLIAARYFTRRIGGITGDALGAANQLVEVCVYLALAARWIV